MKIIRASDSLEHVFTQCLAIDWGIPKCCVAGCQERKVNAIISDCGLTYGLCEAHYQEYNTPGVHAISLEFFLRREL